MADLEGEQERAAGLAAALDDARGRLTAAEGAKEVAEARQGRAQKQVAAANEAAGELEAKAAALAAALQVSWLQVGASCCNCAVACCWHGVSQPGRLVKRNPRRKVRPSLTRTRSEHTHTKTRNTKRTHRSGMSRWRG